MDAGSTDARLASELVGGFSRRAEWRLQPRAGAGLIFLSFQVAAGDDRRGIRRPPRRRLKPRRGSGYDMRAGWLGSWSEAARAAQEQVGFSRQSRAAALAAGRRGISNVLFKVAEGDVRRRSPRRRPASPLSRAYGRVIP